MDERKLLSNIAQSFTDIFFPFITDEKAVCVIESQTRLPSSSGVQCFTWWPSNESALKIVAQGLSSLCRGSQHKHRNMFDSSLTFWMMSGDPKSAPPWRRNPQGEFCWRDRRMSNVAAILKWNSQQTSDCFFSNAISFTKLVFDKLGRF